MNPTPPSPIITITFEPQQLSYRETEVARLIASGFPHKAVAINLGISQKTVEKHRDNIYKKLKVHDIASLTRWAVGRGIVEAT